MSEAYRSYLKGIRVAPRKARLVVDQRRGLRDGHAVLPEPRAAASLATLGRHRGRLDGHRLWRQWTRQARSRGGAGCGWRGMECHQ